MKDKIFVLDASAIIGGFYSKKSANFTTPDVTSEIKDLKSKILLQSAIGEGCIEIKDPDPLALKRLETVLNESGDILRLSEVDKNIVALAITLKDEGYDPTLVTDDYSMVQYGDYITLKTDVDRIMTLSMTQGDAEEFLSSNGVEQVREGLTDDDAVIVGQDPMLERSPQKCQ